MINSSKGEKKIVRPMTPEALENVELMEGQIVALDYQKDASLPTRRRSKDSEWISPESYRAFIVEQLQAKEGHIEEAELDRILLEKYAPAFGKQDRCIIDKREIPQWKQNVAAAKATLYKMGIVCTVRTTQGRRKITHRVLMDPTVTPRQWLEDAMVEWQKRFEKAAEKKKRYEKKKHPADRTVF